MLRTPSISPLRIQKYGDRMDAALTSGYKGAQVLKTPIPSSSAPTARQRYFGAPKACQNGVYRYLIGWPQLHSCSAVQGSCVVPSPAATPPPLLSALRQP